MHSTRPVSRGSTFPLRAAIAALLALGLVLTFAAAASAAPDVRIDSGPRGPTNDPTPQFAFTVDPSAITIDCSIDQGLELYLPCSDTFGPLIPLAEGSYTFRIRADDGVGVTIVTQDFTVDVTRPSLSIVSGPASPSRGTTPEFDFTVDPSATDVECSVDHGSPAYVPCSSPYVSVGLADGDWTFRVRARDAAQNTADDTFDFTVDTMPPALSIGSGQAGPTSDRTPQFAFTAGGDATSVECWVDQGAPVSCASPWTVGAPLADGRHTFHVRASDALGNEATDAQDFSVDATPPALSIDSGPDGPTNDRTPQFAFTAGGDATSVECWVDQGAPVSCASPWTVDAPLADGRHTFHVRVADALGNQLTLTRDFAVDSSAPPLTIDDGPPSQTNNVTPSFAFTTDAPRVECSVDQGTFGPCTSATTYVVGSPLQEGLHTFRVQATSRIGNHAIESRSFTVDTTPPSLAIDSGPSGATSDSTPLFQFTAEAGATVACSIDHGVQAYGPCTDARAHAAVAPLVDGAYTFRVQATDRAGNATTAIRTFTVDTVPDSPAPETPRPGATPPVTRTPSKLRLLSPFPLVRISGTLTSTGARIRLLSVRAPSGALVRVSVSPACSRTRPLARRCRVVEAAGTVGRRDVIRFRRLARRYRSGTVIVVRVWRADRIGKYTRFTIVRGKAPRRVDQCLVPEATSGSRCPTA